MRKPRYAHLFDEDPTFKRWYENLSRGSEWTARTRARDLYRFLRKHDLTPGDLIVQAKKDRRAVEDLLMDFISELHKAKYSPGYIENYLKAVRSWLEFNEIILVRKIKVGNRDRTPTLEDERVPMKEELGQIMNSARERGRCSIALMAFSGVRPQVLGDMRGDDGLEVRDLPEITIENGKVSFSSIPTRVNVRPELSKAKHRYFSFLAEEGCEYLKGYLEKRLAQGETLSERSAIIAVKPGFEAIGWRDGARESGHITTKTLTKEIRDAIRPRFQWRPYVLRAYFDTMLLIAESQGKITHSYRQFFMGHKGDIEARYTTNKARLPESVVEDMREAYRRSQSFLQTREKDTSEDKLKESFRKQLLLVAGFSVEEVEELDPSMDDETFQETVRKRLLGAMANNGANQRIIGVEEVERFLSKGWDFVATLPDDRIVIRLPH
jgi:integrase